MENRQRYHIPNLWLWCLPRPESILDGNWGLGRSKDRTAGVVPRFSRESGWMGPPSQFKTQRVTGTMKLPGLLWLVLRTHVSLQLDSAEHLVSSFFFGGWGGVGCDIWVRL